MLKSGTISGGNITANDVTFRARLNPVGMGGTGATATAKIGSLGLLAGVAGGKAETFTVFNPGGGDVFETVEAVIGSNTTFNASGTILVRAQSVEQAKSRSENVGGGIVGIGASQAYATINGQTLAHSDGTIKNGSGNGAANLTIEASGSHTANAFALATAGGLFAGTKNDSSVTVTPTVKAYISNSTVKVGSNVSIDATSTPEGDSQTRGTTVGVLEISGSESHTTVSPKVMAYIASGAQLTVGGLISVSATAKPQTNNAPDYVIREVKDGGGTEDQLKVINHGLQTGDTIAYDNNGATVIGGLVGTHTELDDDGNPIIIRRQYNVLDVIHSGAVDPDYISLGSVFDGQACAPGKTSCINPTNDTILFGAAHNFENGDPVHYDPQFGTVATVGGLTSGVTYYVLIIDDRTIRLVSTQSQATNPASFVKQFHPSGGAPSIGGDNQTITILGHGFSNGDAVTYHAPPASTFSNAQVDTDFSTSDGHLTLPDVPGNDNVIFIDGDGNLVAAPFNDGDLVIYDAHTDDGSTVVPIGGLSQGVLYRVVKTTDIFGRQMIQFKRGKFLDNLNVQFNRDNGTVTRTSGSWIDDGFGAGQTIIIDDSINDGTYTVSSVSLDERTLTIASPGTLTGTSVSGTFTFTPGSGSNPDTITRSSGNFSGVSFGGSVTITGAGGNSGTYSVVSLSTTTLSVPHGSLSSATTGGVTIDRTGGTTADFDSPIIALTPQKNPAPPQPSGPPNPNPGNTVHTLLKPGDRPIKIASGGSTSRLVDGRTYYVRNVVGNTFQLSEGPSSAILTFDSSGLNAGTFHGLSKTVDIDASSGDQALRIDVSGSLPAGTHQLTGPGGVPLNVISPPVGDGVTSAVSTGSGGGLVGIGANTANVTENPEVEAHIDAALITAGSVSVSSNSHTNITTSSKNTSGGLVGYGHADSTIDSYNRNEAWINDGSRVIATGNVTISATSSNKIFGSVRATGGGGIGVANAEDSTVNLDYKTTARVHDNADVLAGGHFSLSARTATDATANGYASGLGFGADGHSNGDAFVGKAGNGATTEVSFGDNSSVIANSVAASSIVGAVDTGDYVVSGLHVNGHSESYGAGLYSEGIDEAHAETSADNNVLISAHAQITGLEGVDLKTRYEDVHTFADSFARSTGLFGYVSADATNNTDLRSKVDGADDAQVTAGPRDNAGPLAHPSDTGYNHLAFLIDQTNEGFPPSSAGANGHVSRRSLAAGSGDEHGHNQDVKPEIHFSSDVLILSGRTPQLFIDTGGNITLAVEASVKDGGVDKTSGHINDSTIFVNDIINPGPGDVLFRSDKITGGGVGSTWDFRDTLQQVRIFNQSNKALKINNIQVYRGDVKPTVDLAAPTVTLEFKIKRSVAPTLVDIQNSDTPNILINGLIDNPIGTTSIKGAGGEIRSTGSRGSFHTDFGTSRQSLIRTNILNIEAPGANVGQSSPRVNVDVVDSQFVPQATPFRTGRVSDLTDSIYLGRHQFYTGEQVKYHADSTVIGGLAQDGYYYVLASGDGLSLQLSLTPGGSAIPLSPGGSPLDGHTLTPVQRFRVDTPGDVWLDVMGHLRQTGVPHYYVIIDAITAGHNANVLLQSSVRETSTGFQEGIFVIYPSHGAPGETHFTFYNTPDGSAPHLDAGVFGSSPVDIESTYDFRALDTDGNRTLPGVVAGLQGTPGNIIIKAQNFNPSDVRVNVLGITEIIGTFGPGDETLGDQHHIDVLTNGDITLYEKTHDLRVGRIESTAHDVLLYSPRMIVDALNDPYPTGGGDDGTDVIGVNITMCPGSGLLTDLRTASATAPLCFDDNKALGGVGRTNNWVETDVDTRNGVGPLGVVRIFDTFADFTRGVFIGETKHDLKVHTIDTLGDVAARTEHFSGSIVDARNGGSGLDTPANIFANFVYLDANAGSIGSLGNDLEIDSALGREGFDCSLNSVNPPLQAGCFVALEADSGIFLTEVDGPLHLALAHANGGNIRLTVRESADLDEHLNLLKNGTPVPANAPSGALFAESGPDNFRPIPKGTIFAEAGNVELRVGDNVNTDPNSQILAFGSIDIYGDDASRPLAVADPNFGTTMTLRGIITADCVVTASTGTEGATAMGSCTPGTRNPLGTPITNIWGNTDVDTFQFGDSTGLPTALSLKDQPGDPGYIFIGSKTIAHGNKNLSSAGHDGEDEFVVWYLQTTDVGGNQDVAIIHSLTLDGQGDSDYYAIYTTGSRSSSPRDYVVNILDTGAPDNGVDEASIFGFDNSSPSFNGYQSGTTVRNPNDDLFLLRRVACIATVKASSVNSSGLCTTAHESADKPAFVALLHGGADDFRFNGPGDTNASQNTFVQRINYDAALNGRLNVYGLGGNDEFYVDDNSATTSLQGGEGYDYFQFGQVFGLKRDCLTAAGADPGGCAIASDNFLASLVKTTHGGFLRPENLPPALIATTRGWLTPGPSAPLVAQGGTGNDEFVTYSNHAELRQEGDDDSDLFVVRAFALAAVCDTDANSDGICSALDLDDPFGVDLNDPDGTGPLLGDGICDAPIDPTKPLVGSRPRKDNNHDSICNAADAHMTGGQDDFTHWQDDHIIFDLKDGRFVARPIIGLGFSVGHPLDVRAGGGDDEVQYNVNAPVSVDGGTGIDKLIVLGTEFADDIVITDKGVFGAGLNVRYANVEIVEVDGLEGDDQFFVQSTAFGVAYRVIGGLGSDSINVTGDIVTDIVTRELEGISGYSNHLVVSPGCLDNNPATGCDIGYDGLPVDGIDYNLATPNAGNIIITETGSGTTVRESGAPRTYDGTAGSNVDKYSVELAGGSYHPGHPVYITVSIGRSPQEEGGCQVAHDLGCTDDLLHNPTSPAGLTDGIGDTMWVCTSATGDDTACNAFAEYQRHPFVHSSTASDIPARSVTLRFDDTNFTQKQWIYVFAVDDPRSEGDRVVVVQHSVISDDAAFDFEAVRNVEVRVLDNDTPGVYVTEVQKGTDIEDQHTIVVENTYYGDVGGGATYTGLDDEVLVALAKEVPFGFHVQVEVQLDPDSAQALVLWNPLGDSRFNPNAGTRTIGGLVYNIGTILFDSTNWNDPVRVGVKARHDFRPEDPQTAVVTFAQGAATDDPNYNFPNLRSGPGLLDIDVIDDDTPGVVVLETGTGTLVEKCGNALCTIPGDTDHYTLRLTKRPCKDLDPQPTSCDVRIVVLTDGLTDVKSINGVPVVLQPIGGYVPSRLFLGTLNTTASTLTRANGSDLGSFLDQGFAAGQFIRVSLPGAPGTFDVYIQTVTATTITLTASSTPLPAGTNLAGATISRLTRQGLFEGNVSFVDVGGDHGRQVVRTVGFTDPGFLSDDFLEGQRVRVSLASNPALFADFKIQLIRGDNKAKDNKLEFTAETVTPVWWTGSANVVITRLAPVATFTRDNWFVQQDVELVADVNFVVPPTRDGVKVFPASTHLLSKLRGPLAVEGGVTGADRSLKNGIMLPGEQDDALFEIGIQPAESRSIDVLNIYNDSSQQDRTGTMTSVSLTGFGMAKDLTFAGSNPFGEPATFPGGISFGSIAFVDGHFETDGAKSSIEVVNLLLGSGNDKLDIQGTLDPAPPVSAKGTVHIAGTATGGTITKDGFDWESFGFLVGQIVRIDGIAGTWTVGSITGFGHTELNLVGAPLPTSTALHAITAEDPALDTTGSVSIVGAADGGTLTRTGFDWKAYGLVVGQQIMIGGLEPSVWRLMGISGPGNSVLTLGRGPALTSAGASSRRVYVPGQHGGLTLVHGGGNHPLSINGEMDTTTSTVTRRDGLDWRDDGYTIGQIVQLTGEANTRTIVSFTNWTCPPPPPDESAFAACGTGSVMVLGPTAAASGAGASSLTRLVTNAVTTVQVSDPKKISTTGSMTITVQPASGATLPTSTLTCSSCNFTAAGFKANMNISITGLAGQFTIGSLDATHLVLRNAALTPTLLTTITNEGRTRSFGEVPLSLTVFGYDPILFGGAARIGGDTITVCSATNPIPCGSVNGGPNSPLVVYGDTSQDGVWYAGHPYDTKGYDFGPKPFDPFTNLPVGENEDADWIFPLADPYDYAGNDVIDAHNLFANIVCNATCSNLPTVGITAYGGPGNDLILGSQTGDHLAGGSGDDTILGQRGADHIYGDSGVNVNILTRALSIETTNHSPAPTLDPFSSGNGDTTMTPLPSPVADTMDAGRDVIYGEGAGTVAGGPQEGYDDIIFGDHGFVRQDVIDPNLPDTRLQKIQTTTVASLLGIESREYQNGGDDVIFGNVGRDVIVGGAGNDLLDGGEQDDLLFGDNVWIERTLGDFTSPRFQTLCGTLLYSRSDRTNACPFGNPVTADNSGTLLTDGTPRTYRDPDGAPWWAEYDVAAAPVGGFTPQISGLFQNFQMDEGSQGAGSFGNDYIAGNQAHDMIFGQLGRDIVQGDGSIDSAFAAGATTGVRTHVGASRTPAGCTHPGSVDVCDYTGDLDIVPSFEASTDGQDYIEGNGGYDILFGGLGQDDIVGGNSDMFSLTDVNLRPDSADLIFGGAGTKIDRNTFAPPSDGSLVTDVHARDADAIVSDNGDIIRIAGINHVDGMVPGAPPTNLYPTFNYDTHGPEGRTSTIVVRGVRLIDYTPGGPDYSATNGLGLFPGFDGTSCHGTNKYHDIGGYDEVHGETGDDTIYTGCGNDFAYGDAQDDDIVMGWGQDWADGGTGEDGVLGDDGRIYTSRNSSSYGEPLYGILALLASDPDDKFSNGNVIDEFIYTPGMMQQTTINIHDELKKTVDLTPFWVDPNTPEDLDPHADTLYMDDILYGGLGLQTKAGHDWLHGGAGDDAISGAEALAGPAYLQVPTTLVDSAGLLGIAQSDWNHPFNPGNTLRFSIEAAKEPGGAHGPVLRDKRAGQFALYDDGSMPKDRILPPRIKIRLSLLDGLKVGPAGAEWFLNFDAADPGAFFLPGGTAGQGGQVFSYAGVYSDGDDLAFGDAGNDWMVGGTGQDTFYGGSGNDLLNMDDDHTTNNEQNDTTDTHPSYEDRAFGGAGKDVLIANTGGDRLIDWVGEFNSYLVPFAPFGMATVSRTNQPQLPEFLYALSASHGADPTRTTDVAGADPARNGEPWGELALVRQPNQDGQLWHDQTGPPSDPQAGNIPGGRRDVLRTASATSVHGGGKAKAGSIVSLTFTITNSGSKAQTNVALMPTFPTGGSVKVAFRGGSSTAGGVTCDLYGCVLASLDRDSTADITLDFEILSADSAGSVELGALVASAQSTGFDTVADTVDVGLANPGAAALTSDSGSSATDHVTNVSRPQLSGTYRPNFKLLLFDGATQIASVTTDAAGNWSFTASVAWADGVHTITTQAVDASGVASDASAALSFTIDTQGPSLTLPGAITVVTDPGKTAANVPYSYLAGDNLPGATGSCSAASGSSFAIGTTTVTCTATDAAGNTASGSFTVTVQDWKVVAKPGKPKLGAGSDTGKSSSDNVTNVKRPSFVVIAPAGATVQILENGVVLASALADATGTAVVQLTADLADGSHNFTSSVFDPASGATTLSDALGVTIDTKAASGSFTVNGGANVNNGMDATNDPVLSLTLTFTETNGTLEISVDGGATWMPAEDYVGTEAAQLTGTDGVKTVSVRVTDAAGNSVVVSKQVRLDRSGPSITESGLTNGGVYDLNQLIKVTFGATDADNVKTLVATLDTKALASGTTISTNTLTAGGHQLVITATDALGNKSTLTINFTIRVSTGGLSGAVNDGVSRGLVDYSVSVQLNNALGAAQSAINRGDKAGAKSQLQSFIAKIQSNAGARKIDAGYAAQLIGWANDLIASLG